MFEENLLGVRQRSGVVHFPVAFLGQKMVASVQVASETGWREAVEDLAWAPQISPQSAADATCIIPPNGWAVPCNCPGVVLQLSLTCYPFINSPLKWMLENKMIASFFCQ